MEESEDEPPSRAEPRLPGLQPRALAMPVGCFAKHAPPHVRKCASQHRRGRRTAFARVVIRLYHRAPNRPSPAQVHLPAPTLPFEGKEATVTAHPMLPLASLKPRPWVLPGPGDAQRGKRSSPRPSPAPAPLR